MAIAGAPALVNAMAAAAIIAKPAATKRTAAPIMRKAVPAALICAAVADACVISAIMPRDNAVVFHGAVLSYNGKAYAFTARSGVGKTTHTRLWLSEIGGDVHYLNGDKPIFRLIDGIPYAFGTPWRGKEGYGVNESAPLAAIALLERGERNTALSVSAQEGVLRLVKQIYIPRDPISAAQAMRVADGILSTVRFVELKCNMEPEAARVAAEAMIKD